MSRGGRGGSADIGKDMVSRMLEEKVVEESQLSINEHAKSYPVGLIDWAEHLKKLEQAE